ncbi:MAG: radical SAM family heme chaperone HemW [Candidatus Eisenbacteria bacterium]
MSQAATAPGVAGNGASTERAAEGPAARVRAESGPGVYVHVPFCAARCGYCDFASGSLSAAAVERYLTGIERELERRAPGASGTVFRSVFFGGGTPSALSSRHFRRLWSALRAHLSLASGAEITLEVNPESASDARISGWLDAGVNRLSFGVQSFHDDELARLGRLHDAERAARAFLRARALGVPMLSLDLMFAFPDHTRARWDATLDRCLSLEPEHLSAYAFIVEAGTPLGNAVLRGEQATPEPELEAELYETLIDRTSAAGLAGYETSNFCVPGAESRHNLGYWLRRPYLSLGPSAHGLFAGVRYANYWSLDRWAEALERGLLPESEREPESDESRARETILLGLRLGSGLVLDDSPGVERDILLARYGPALEGAVRAGRLERTVGGYRVHPRHRFVADDIIAWVDAAASRAFDRSGCTPIIPSPCPNLPSLAV